MGMWPQSLRGSRESDAMLTVSAVDFGRVRDDTRYGSRMRIGNKDGRKTDTVAIAMDPTGYSLSLASQ